MIKQNNKNFRKVNKVIKESITTNNINVNKITREVNNAIKDAVNYVDSGDAYPTWSWSLGYDDKYFYDLVLGFSSGFEHNENEFTDSYGDGLCLKWARIKKNSAMNEYDIDYEFPYDETTGDVWDSEITINDYDATSEVDFLIRDFIGYADQDLFVDESCKQKFKRKPMKEYVDEVSGVIKCIETGEEYGYRDLQTREYIISDLVEKGYTYKDRPISIETGYFDESNHPNWMDDDVGFDIPWYEEGFAIPKSAKDKIYKRGYWKDRADRLIDKNKTDIQDESLKRNKLNNKMREASRTMNPQFDSRKSFYGKAHVVTDDDGTEILYSYDTPVVEIKDGKVELLAQWDSSQTTLRHVKEFLQQNGFKADSKAQIAKMYGRAVESVRKFRR